MFNEKSMQVLFGHWAKSIMWADSAAFELKLCKEKRFNLKRIEDHQIKNLQLVEGRGLFYKIPDEGMAQKPFDGFVLKGRAYLVLMFYKPRQLKTCYLIPIVTIIGKIEDGIKSIDEKEASNLAQVTFILKS